METLAINYRSIENVEIKGAASGVQGDAGDNVITATGDFDNSLAGGAGSDSIDGGAGDDSIDGGTGNDSLTDGAGDDIFVYDPGDSADTICPNSTPIRPMVASSISPTPPIAKGEVPTILTIASSALARCACKARVPIIRALPNKIPARFALPLARPFASPM